MDVDGLQWSNYNIHIAWTYSKCGIHTLGFGLKSIKETELWCRNK